MRAAALVADPAGDADGQIQLQIALQLRGRTGETMGDAAHQGGAVFAHDGDEIIVGIAFVQEHRFAHPRRQFQLLVKGALLDLARRQVAKVIEAAFPHRHHLGRARQLRKFRQHLLVQFRGMVRMHAGGRKQVPRIGLRERQRPGAARQRWRR